MKVIELIELIKEAVSEEDIDINQNTPLIGGNSSIDSMNLVQICLALEDKSQEDGFEFDWRSEKVMSSLNSFFKTPETLTQEYNRQKNNFVS